MVNTSKILTVSYGTFSCTLEGFDDSFDTMKAIAEYFRDLAADDRYFGATPPTPDAEMLARIAEKEIERRVEARQEQGGIVLRAAQAAVAAPALTQPAPEAEPVSLTEEMTETQEVPSADSVEEQDAMEIAAADADDLAARLDAAQSEADPEAEPEATQDPEAEPEAAQDPEAEIEAEVEAEVAEEAAEPAAPKADEAEAAPIVPRRPHMAKAITATVTANVSPAEKPAVTPVAHPDTDSVAAKLARIRSVVSRDVTADDANEAIYTEDEHAEAFLDDSAAAEAMDSRLDQDDAEDAIRAAAQSYEDDWDEAEETAEIEAFEEAVYEDLSEDEEYEEETLSFDADEFDPEAFAAELNDAAEAEEDARAEAEAEASEEDDLDDILDRLIHRGAKPVTDESTDEIEEEDEADAFEAEAEAEDQPFDLAGYEDADAAEESAETEAEAEAPQPAIRARVMKMKRADFEAAIERGLLEEDEDAYEEEVSYDEAAYDEDGADDDWQQSAGGDLSPEAEAELQRELAEVEAELGDLDDSAAYDDFDDEDEDEMELDDEDEVTSIFAEDDEDDEPAQPALRSRLPDSGDEGDVSRLMAKARREMDEPEGSNRRASIAHLRAAVAATKAEKDAGTLRRSEDQVKAYQDDLASVVRPRRLTAGEGRTSRRPEADTRPAPLKLVAEQRVDDAPAAAPAQPVRPRRVSMSAETGAASAPAADAGNFAEFAEEMGASTLPELLEAAASYLSFVEGQEQFSRPQLMTKARQIQGEEFSREDGLRSFGMLLRQGKIEKLKGGRFTVSDSIGYRPDARQAG